MTDFTHMELELEAILHASNDNIIVTDDRGIVLRAIKNSEEFYGEPSEKMIGKSVYELEKMNVFSPSVTRKVLEEKRRSKASAKNSIRQNGYGKGHSCV